MIRLRMLIMLMLIYISILSVSARSEDPVSISVHNLDLLADKVSVPDGSPIEFSEPSWEKLILGSNNSVSGIDFSSTESNANHDVLIVGSNSNIKSNLEILDQVVQNPVGEMSNSDAERYLKILYDQAADRGEGSNHVNVGQNYDIDRNIKFLYESAKNSDENSDVLISGSNSNIKSNLEILGKVVQSPVSIGESNSDAGRYLRALYEQTEDKDKREEKENWYANLNYENTDSNLRYLYGSTGSPKTNSDIRITGSNGNSGPNFDGLSRGSQVSDEYNKLESDLNYISKSQKDEPEQNSAAIENAGANLNLLVQSDRSTANQSSIPSKSSNELDSYSGESTNHHGDGYAYKNYAIIVGINDYSHMGGLGTSVNDANEVEKLLKKYGYNIIKLTDDTENRPTKYNILKGALADISLEQEGGNIVFYFSGHAEKDNKGRLYLLPQDANGNFSSYISCEELRGYFKDLKNLAVIIDACNSGAINYNDAGLGQLILTSSKEDEPSNEDWLGPFSMFTHQLCNAVNEEGKLGGKISLQRCFDIARTNTFKLSRSYLLYQTPTIIDKTGGVYYLN